MQADLLLDGPYARRPDNFRRDGRLLHVGLIHVGRRIGSQVAISVPRLAA